MLEATLDAPEVFVATEDDISSFCAITGDNNKVHEQGPNQIVPGFWIDFKAKQYFDRITNPKLHFTGLDIRFRQPLLKDQPCEVTYTVVEEQGAKIYELRIVRDGTVVSEGSITYQAKREDPANAKLTKKIIPYPGVGQPYALSEEYYDQVAHALKLGHQDRIAGAVSKVSNALQKDHENSRILINEATDERHPYFAKHDLIVYDGIDTALERNGVIIHCKKGQPKLETYPVYVRGTDAGNRPLFDLTAAIRFQ